MSDKRPQQGPGSSSIAYFSELRAHWRPLLAATVGLGTGMSLAGIVISTMAPSLISGNGWSKADFAMIGTLGLFLDRWMVRYRKHGRFGSKTTARSL